MTLNEFFKWANDNQGVLSAFAIVIALPTVAILIYQAVRRFWPSKRQRQIRIKEEFAHAETLKKQVEANIEWNEIRYYGEFLIRDFDRKLPQTEENHSSIETPYSIATLVEVHSEHLEFVVGCMGIKHIKKIAGFWYFADESEDGAIKVETVFWLNYRDIVCIRWETNNYWEWPQICCNFTAARKFPLSRVFFAQEAKGVARPFYNEICLVKDVGEKPYVLKGQL